MNKGIVLKYTPNPLALFKKVFSFSMPAILVYLTFIPFIFINVFYYSLLTHHSLLPIRKYLCTFPINYPSFSMFKPLMPVSSITQLFCFKEILAISFKKIVCHLPFVHVSIWKINDTFTFIIVVLDRSLIKTIFVKS